MSEIYLGRIVSVGRTPEGRLAAMYRVSSRSFPNRKAQAKPDGVAIVPKEGYEGDVYKNPYIAYNCARVVRDVAIASNGSHTDPIAEKIASGMSVRDALVYSLAVMDYEKDDYNTPRIAAIVRKGDSCGWLGTVRHDGLDVQCFDLPAGSCVHLSTYEHAIPGEAYRAPFSAVSAEDACDFVLAGGVFAGFTNPVTGVCLVESDTGFAVATRDND